MRPPQNTGGNQTAGDRLERKPFGFNEAPAEHGGEQPLAIFPKMWEEASMRPPQNTGGNTFPPKPVRVVVGLQ